MYTTYIKLIFLHFSFAQTSEILQCAKNTFADPSNYFIIQNGTCYKRLGQREAASRIPSSRFYQRFHNNVLLMKAHAQNGTKGHYYQKPHSYNQTINKYEYNFLNFQSILLQEWTNIRPTMLNVTFKYRGNNIVGWISFRVNSNDTLESCIDMANFNDSSRNIPRNVVGLVNTYLMPILRGDQPPGPPSQVTIQFVGTMCPNLYNWLTIDGILAISCCTNSKTRPPEPKQCKVTVFKDSSLDKTGIYDGRIQIFVT